MGFALWIDREERMAWAQGTHEYRPLGAAAVAMTDRFRPKDFSPVRRCPPRLRREGFAGFFGSLEELNETMGERRAWRLRGTPIHVR